MKFNTNFLDSRLNAKGTEERKLTSLIYPSSLLPGAGPVWTEGKGQHCEKEMRKGEQIPQGQAKDLGFILEAVGITVGFWAGEWHGSSLALEIEEARKPGRALQASDGNALSGERVRATRVGKPGDWGLRTAARQGHSPGVPILLTNFFFLGICSVYTTPLKAS